MQNNKIILLNEDLILGKGTNKIVYFHPDDTKKCIKINSPHAGLDHSYEMRYRKMRKIHHLPPSSLLTEYYGAVKTNLGEGFIFERVCDYDGTTSKTIADVIILEMEARKNGKSVKELLESEKEIPAVIDVLFQFRRVLFQDNIILPNMHAGNYMVQFTSPTDWQVRIVDDIGARTLIPIIHYIDFLGKRYVRRHWERFMNLIETSYPGFFTEKEIAYLRGIK